MKKVYLLVFSVFIYFGLNAQSKKGKVIQEFNSAGQVTGAFHYKDGKKNGDAKTYDPSTGNIVAEGDFKNDLKQGDWQYYNYKNGNKSLYQVIHFDSGQKTGPFTHWIDNEIIKGTFSQGQLSGPYSINTFSVLGTGDTLTQPLIEGNYLDGKKSGSWKYYKNNKISQSGSYYNDKKNGTWKDYDTQGNLMDDYQYSDGQKSGIFHTYFAYKKGKKENIKSTGTYVEGELNGHFKQWDDKGIIAEGSYSDGKRLGKWKIRSSKGNMTADVRYFDGIITGAAVYYDAAGNKRIDAQYLNGKKNGSWTYFNTNGTKITEENYKNDSLNGLRILYDQQGDAKSTANYENGLLTDLKISKPKAHYTIHYNDDHSLQVAYHYTQNDTSYIKTYSYKSQQNITQENFASNFQNAVKSDKKDCYLNGDFEKHTKGNTIILGYYTDGKKDGLWKYMYSPQVLWQANYDNGVIAKETFTETATKSPYDGKYIVSYPNGNIRFEFKVDDGKRDGKSRWYDKKGNVVKQHKYSKGILVK